MDRKPFSRPVPSAAENNPSSAPATSSEWFDRWALGSPTEGGPDLLIALLIVLAAASRGELRSHLPSLGAAPGILGTAQSQETIREPNSSPSIPEPAEEYVNRRQRFDYATFRDELEAWLGSKGADPESHTGLAEDTVNNYLARIDQFLRWVWEQFDGYTSAPRPEHADAFIEALQTDEITKENGEPYAGGSKRKLKNSVSKLFEWRARERGGEEWETDVTFDEQRQSRADEFTIGERRALREAVLEFDDLPSYGDVTPQKRDNLKGHIAQKLGKPEENVSPTDWDRVSSWKIPSLLWTALDAGLRPVEVKRSHLGWLRLEKGSLFIPKDQAAKNRDFWDTSLSSRTVMANEQWLDEREQYPEYDGTDAIWLNQHNNPYESGPLNTILDHVMEEAGIDQTNRELSWYSLRHSVGTHMASKGGIEQAREQLRHKSLESTLQYTHPSVEERRDTLEDIG